MSPENLAIASKEIQKIMTAVEDTAGMKQPEEVRWLVREEGPPGKVN